MKNLHLGFVLAGSIAILPSALAQQTSDSNAPRNQSQIISHGNTSGHNTASADSAVSADQAAKSSQPAKKAQAHKKVTRRPTKKTSKTQQKTRSAANPSGSSQK